VTWEFDDLTTADGHQLRATFHASVRALDDPTELKMLEEVLLNGRPFVTAAQVMSHFSPSLRSVAQQTVKDLPANRCMAEPGRSTLCEALKKSAVDLAFGCGLEVLAPIRLEVDSPTLTQQQLQAMHRTLAEQDAAGRVEHFQKAVDLLNQFESQRSSTAAVAVTKAIESLNPADRGSMLKTLLLAGSAKSGSAALWAVAGTSLVRVDLASDALPVATALPSSLGPLRSVQIATIDGERYWAVGARDGVFLSPFDRPADAVVYRDGGVESAQGFSRVVVRNGAIIGCHSDAGLVSWTLGSPDRPAAVHRPSELGGSPRNLLPLDGSHLLFSVGGQLMSIADDGALQKLAAAGTSGVAAIIPDWHRFFVAYEDGTLRALEKATRSLITLEHRGQRISSAAGLPWLGGRRLLLAGDDGAIDCVGIEDDMLTQYASQHRGVRRIVASTSHVAALSADRMRVVIWNSWEGKTPAREISLARVTPHRIADLLLA